MTAGVHIHKSLAGRAKPLKSATDHLGRSRKIQLSLLVAHTTLLLITTYNFVESDYSDLGFV